MELETGVVAESRRVVGYFPLLREHNYDDEGEWCQFPGDVTYNRTLRPALELRFGRIRHFLVENLRDAVIAVHVTFEEIASARRLVAEQKFEFLVAEHVEDHPEDDINVSASEKIVAATATPTTPAKTSWAFEPRPEVSHELFLAFEDLSYEQRMELEKAQAELSVDKNDSTQKSNSNIIMNFRAELCRALMEQDLLQLLPLEVGLQMKDVSPGDSSRSQQEAVGVVDTLEVEDVSTSTFDFSWVYVTLAPSSRDEKMMNKNKVVQLPKGRITIEIKNFLGESGASAFAELRNRNCRNCGGHVPDSFQGCYATNNLGAACCECGTHVEGMRIVDEYRAKRDGRFLGTASGSSWVNCGTSQWTGTWKNPFESLGQEEALRVPFPDIDRDWHAPTYDFYCRRGTRDPALQALVDCVRAGTPAPGGENRNTSHESMFETFKSFFTKPTDLRRWELDGVDGNCRCCVEIALTAAIVSAKGHDHKDFRGGPERVLQHLLELNPVEFVSQLMMKTHGYRCVTPLGMMIHLATTSRAGSAGHDEEDHDEEEGRDEGELLEVEEREDEARQTQTDDEDKINLHLEERQTRCYAIFRWMCERGILTQDVLEFAHEGHEPARRQARRKNTKQGLLGWIRGRSDEQQLQTDHRDLGVLRSDPLSCGPRVHELLRAYVELPKETREARLRATMGDWLPPPPRGLMLSSWSTSTTQEDMAGGQKMSNKIKREVSFSVTDLSGEVVVKRTLTLPITTGEDDFTVGKLLAEVSEAVGTNRFRLVTTAGVTLSGRPDNEKIKSLL